MTLRDKVRIIPRCLISDERGWFFKAITGTEENIPSHTGEVYLTMGKPGKTKGGHYHLEAFEWFTVIQGETKLILEDIETKERMEISMNLKESISVFVPCKVAHVLVNTGNSDFILLAYTDKLYDPKDTIPYQINL